MGNLFLPCSSCRACRRDIFGVVVVGMFKVVVHQVFKVYKVYKVVGRLQISGYWLLETISFRKARRGAFGVWL